jgi:FAD/FMN-containing dehydrogenase
MNEFKTSLVSAGFKGDIDDSAKTLDTHSHDASLFELRPQVVVFPKNTEDVKTLIKLVNKQKAKHPSLSITARSAGTDMSGGAINDSIIANFNKYFTKIGKITRTTAQVEPGVFYRDFEKETFKYDALMPSFPASRDLCTVGGMVANNSGGEKSLEFGKTENFINELSMVFADGNEYTVKPLNLKQLKAKMAKKTYEGKLYKKLYELIEANYDIIKAAKPNVSKNSTGYNLWDVWDKQSGIFDMTKLLVGAQGTLGLTTDINFRLVPNPKHQGTLVMFLRSTDDLGSFINKVMEHKPAAFEGFDNYTLMLSFKLFFSFHKLIGWKENIKLAIQLIPNALMLFRGIPKMVMLAEFTGETPEEVSKKVHALRVDMEPFHHETLFEEDDNELKERKFWIMRRSSFQLLRSKVKDKHTAPYIDDFVVNPEYLPKFLPELRAIIKKYKLMATIAGHMGDGNFHIIPLMKLEDKDERNKLQPSMKEVNELVLKYKGSLSGEHNDGLVRGPWLRRMYGGEVLALFKQTKKIFDPENIFNPHKKADANWDYSFSHVRDHF